jgi:hypothetical protein
MQDGTWVKGMAELVVSFPAADQDQEVLRARGAVYRRELGSLTDEAWLYAVRESIRNERWFPTVAQLLDYAGRAPVMAPSAALPDDTRTVEEKRADASRLLAQIKGAVKEREKDLPPTPIVTAQRESVVVDLEASSERLDELRRQREQILATDETVVEGRG